MYHKKYSQFAFFHSSNTFSLNSLSTNHLTQLKTFSPQDGDRVYVIASSLPEVVVAIKRALGFLDVIFFCFRNPVFFFV